MNVYEIVTERIIDQLAKGVIPWQKPWRGQKAMNYVTRKEYKGINTLLLPLPGEYLTFKQVKDQKGKVKKGEKANIIVFFDWIEKDGEEGKEKFPLLKYYNVFHISQCEGIETKLEEYSPDNENQVIDSAQQIAHNYITKENIDFKSIIGSDRAYYQPATDSIVMPDIKQFTDSNNYYATLFHEMAHSTGHISRLDRFSKQKTHAFGSQDYSKEELVAEITSAFICNIAGIETGNLSQNNASYIQSWLKALKNDQRMIVMASSQAQKAAEYILQ